MTGLDVRIWLRIGCLSFGGPAGQIALMQRMLVDELRWIEPSRFLAALNFCMLLPGPEAQQLATYIGWSRAGWRGALVAGGLFVLPGMLLMLALSSAYVLFGRLAPVEALFIGIKAAVLVIVFDALLRITRRALHFRGAWPVAVGTLIAVHALAVPYPVIVALAAAIGWLVGRRGGDFNATAQGTLPSASRPRLRTRWRLVALTALAWVLPLAALLAWRGSDDLISRIGVLYSELALVSFGGAYAVLAYASDRAVLSYGWMSVGQMADGLGLAETTPGPLILVLQFVAFVAAWQSGQIQPSLLFATVASLVGVWCLFAPSFLWIFLAGPQIERIHANLALRSALGFVTAAVVGVIANLSIWFALHVWFTSVAVRQVGLLHVQWPDLATLRWPALALSLIAALLMFGLRQSLLRTLTLTALAGLVVSLR